MAPILANILRPLSAHYEDPATVELRMSEPGAVVVERREQGKFRIEDAALTLPAVELICSSLANLNGLRFDGDSAPKLSCVLPEGHRFEALVGASVQSGLSLAIRCKHPFTPTWAQLGAAGDVERWLGSALARSANVVVSGATNTGKTMLLNMLLAQLPAERRVIAVEDTPELHLGRFWDGVGLLASREESASAGRVGWRELYDHVVRATPDHIVFGEISTQNAYAALSMLNSGVTGFMCTIHAESPRQALERKFDQNIAWAGGAMPRVPEFLRELVDAVVQLARGPDGYRRIESIYEPRRDRYAARGGALLSSAAPARIAAGEAR